MKSIPYPILYEINTRVWLSELSEDLGRQATLDDIPNSVLDEFAKLGFDWIWLLSVWATGELGRKVSRENPEWKREFEESLPDLKEADIGGSGFAIADYAVHPDLGGDAALKRLRTKLQKRNLKLMLDFVPNHMGPDHAWVKDHPDYFIQGTAEDLEKYPLNYRRVKNEKGDLILAYGRDPHFDGWPDTIQLDYSNSATIEAMKQELLRISDLCDGVRCDMAMLILPEVFEKTWNRKALPFWPAAIKEVRESNPDFCFMAEVYWDMERILLQQGFDYAYDKRLYDYLLEEGAQSVREHFQAGLDDQAKLVRFLENHDEQRAASAFDFPKHKAAAVITFLSPGMRFFHQGQLEGKKKKISPHLIRAPHEAVDTGLQKFYASLFDVLKLPLFRKGNWALAECVQAWDGNGSWDSFIGFAWEGMYEGRALVVINYAPHAGQCYLQIPFPDLEGRMWRLQDLMNSVSYERHGNGLSSKGLYLDMEAWQYHVFEMHIVKPA